MKRLIILICLLSTLVGTDRTFDTDPDLVPQRQLLFTKRLILPQHYNQGNFIDVYECLMRQCFKESLYINRLCNEAHTNRFCSLITFEKENEPFVALIKYIVTAEDECEEHIYWVNRTFGHFEKKNVLKKIPYIEPFLISAKDLSNRYIDIMLHSDVDLYLRGLTYSYEKVYKKIRQEGLERAIKKLLIVIDSNLDYSVYSLSNDEDFISIEKFNLLFLTAAETQKRHCNIF